MGTGPAVEGGAGRTPHCGVNRPPASPASVPTVPVDAARRTVVFVHAHPDDEAIFTGGTMAWLAATGHRVVLVVCTGGELGLATDAAVDGPALAGQRRRETEAAAALLGIARVVTLDHRDSGMAGDAANHAPGSFWTADLALAAKEVAAVLDEEAAVAVVGYDERGIYGHPDHVQAHRVTHRAAALAGVATVYDATVDREYLHFVETHLVEEAALTGDLGLVRSTSASPRSTSRPRSTCDRGWRPNGRRWRPTPARSPSRPRPCGCPPTTSRTSMGGSGTSAPDRRPSSTAWPEPARR